MSSPSIPRTGARVPYSDSQGKDVALEWYRKIAPETVLDVGAGSGTYAQLMRPAHGACWTAVEAWEPYLAQFGLFGQYDAVITADARGLGAPIFAVDLVIAGDVLEHMTREDAQGVLSRIRQTAGNLIVSIPVLHLDQDAVNGNPYERHIDHWSADAMRAELGTGLVAEWVGNVLGYWWWQRP